MALVTWEEFEAFLDELPVFVGPEMPFEVASARRAEAQSQRNIADMVRRQEEVANHNLFLFEEKNRVLNSLDSSPHSPCIREHNSIHVKLIRIFTGSYKFNTWVKCENPY